MAGKVWLVGAGPSDRGLLTLKAKEVIEQADVIVYDALVGSEILAMVPQDVECINVGKRASHHIKKQEETNRILLEEALKGKKVVRLKGGDPFLFGRGGEELQLLVENDVPYEIIPGVTSAISVPAYNGIPVTHRDFVSSVHIITGHKKKDEPLDIPFKAFVECKGTLVFLMGVSALSDICQGLREAGMDPMMPAAILQKGTTAEQRRVVATISDLPEKAAEAKIETPAIIVVGRVCSLAEDFGWIEKKELFGCRVVVTRPQDRSSELSSRLRSLGAQVIEIPAIRTRALDDMSRLDAAIADLGNYQWIAFTSPAGVKVFMEELRRCHKDVRSLAGCKVAALGKGTAKELEKYGLFADLMPATYDGQNLGMAIAAEAKAGERVLLPRASKGNPEIVAEIQKNPNVTVDDIAIYDTLFEKPVLLDEKAEFEQHPQTMAVFTSASTVKGFLAATEGLDVMKIRALCIGKQTAAEAEKAGMQVYVSEKATMDAMVELVRKVYAEE